MKLLERLQVTSGVLLVVLSLLVREAYADGGGQCDGAVVFQIITGT